MSFTQTLHSTYEVVAKKDPKSVIQKFLSGDEVEFRDDYSGRGMFGKVSTIAFVIPRRLTEKEKKALEKKLGVYMSSDRMGMNFIYYVS